MGKKALVTGGAGFIGSNLALALEADGVETVVLDDFSSGDFRNLDGFKGDVIPESAAGIDWQRFSRTDVIFHQQAVTDTTVMDQKWMLEQNTESFRRLLSFCIQKNIPLIYASSAGVYGNEPPPVRESGSIHPLNIYGYSKWRMDQLAAKAMREAGRMITGLRYFNVFGPHESYKQKAASMIYQLAEQMHDGQRPKIFEFGEQKRDHIYVKDVVSANLCAWKAKKSVIVNVGTGIATTFNRLIEVIKDALAIDPETEYFKNPYPFYQNHTQADIALAEKTIGFHFRWGIEEGIRDYLTDFYDLSGQNDAAAVKPKTSMTS